MSTSNSTPSKFKLGIDLGTTNSLAAIVRNGHVMVLKNHEGENCTKNKRQNIMSFAVAIKLYYLLYILWILSTPFILESLSLHRF